MLKRKYLIVAMCFFALLLMAAIGALVFTFLQPASSGIECSDTIIPNAENYIEVPKTIPSKLLQINSMELIVLADAGEFEEIKGILSKTMEIEIEYVSPENFDSKKNNSLILIVFGFDSSETLKEIVKGILSEEELALAEKSIKPFSLIKENSFMENQQIALYLGKDSSEALEILEKSFNPMTKEELEKKVIAVGGAKQHFEEEMNTEKKDTSPLQSIIGFFSLGTISFDFEEDITELSDEMIEWYQDNYGDIDEEYPSYIWDTVNCIIVAMGGEPCDAQNAVYVVGLIGDSEGIYPIDYGDRIPEEKVLMKQYLGLLLPFIDWGHTTEEEIVEMSGLLDIDFSDTSKEGQELIKGNFPNCYTYKLMHAWIMRPTHGTSQYEYFHPELIEIILPRCYIPEQAIYFNIVYEVEYAAYYKIWGITNMGPYILDDWYKYNSTFLFTKPNIFPKQITDETNTAWLLTSIQLKLMQKHFLQENGYLWPSENSSYWEKTQTTGIEWPEITSLNDINESTTSFFQVTRATRINTNYTPWHKIKLENKEAWKYGSDYAEKEFVEKYLLTEQNFFVERAGWIEVTAPSFSLSDDPFKEWYVNGAKAVSSDDIILFGDAEPRKIKIQMNSPKTIEAKFRPDFSIEVPSNIYITQGETKYFDLNISSIIGTQKDVIIEVLQNDSNLLIELDKTGFTGINANSKLTSKLNITVPYSAPPKTYELKVKVSIGNTVEEKTITAYVKLKDWGFYFNAVNALKLINAGQSASYDVEIQSIDGFNLPINFLVENLPSGANYSLSENPCIPTANGIKTIHLTITTSSSTPMGSYHPKIIASTEWRRKFSNAVSTTFVTLNVTRSTAAGEDFTITLNPTTVSVNPGGTGIINVTLTPSSGFNSLVTLSTDNLPENAGAAFNPANSVVLQNNTPVTITINITTSGTTPLGTYNFSVNAIGGNSSHAKIGSITIR
ncbi:MAG: hypothetical protein ABIA76_05505 [Candidatus Diapherotrites archaeon]